jgi:uncharacterized protein (DUF2252 family)
VHDTPSPSPLSSRVRRPRSVGQSLRPPSVTTGRAHSSRPPPSTARTRALNPSLIITGDRTGDQRFWHDELMSDPGEQPAVPQQMESAVPSQFRAEDKDARRGVGRAARERVARAELGRWAAADRGHDPLATVIAQNGMRRPELVPIRFGRMSASGWNYYRGAAAVAAADLGSRSHTGLTVQLCGDAHILNFGLWATPERSLAFDLRDFDETLPGPFEWDVSRLVASIVVLAREHGVKPGAAERAVQACLRSYRQRMSGYTTRGLLDIWYDMIKVDDFLEIFSGSDRRRGASHIASQSLQRTSVGAARKLTERVGGQLRITDDPPIREHFTDDVAATVYTEYRNSLQEDRRHLLDRYTAIDVVRQVVGVGSVGMRVFLILLTGADVSDPLFLQIKQAGPSVYEPYAGSSTHGNHGQRVIVGKRLIQSATDIFVGWTRAEGNDYYVRQFRDQKIIADGEMVAPRLLEFATACGAVLARSHARTGDPVAIDAYIGHGRQFDRALIEFAFGYADQTEQDHQHLADAVRAGVIASAAGW